MEIVDSRRLPGPNLFSSRPGAVLDVKLAAEEDPDAVRDAWSRHVRALLTALGFADSEIHSRRFHAGLSLMITAPIDALYAATEVNETAFAQARIELLGQADPAPLELAALVAAVASEKKPLLLELQTQARAQGVAFLWDDRAVSLGMGAFSQTWSTRALPDPADLDWSRFKKLPTAMVTGTNGKTTTVRLLAAMSAAAGRVEGHSSTDGCWVAGAEIGEGDFSGPVGARLVLRDQRVEIAILETARGGMLRRGLGLENADVAILTNVAEDHLGEWGINDVDELWATKFIIRRAAKLLVLNADDPLTQKHRAEVESVDLEKAWIALDAATVAAEKHAAFCRDGAAILRVDGREHEIARLEDIPMTLGGAARHNVSNALGAIVAAERLQLPLPAIKKALASFDSSAAGNPGRLNRFNVNGATAIVDFAHNPHGVEAVMATMRALAPPRLLVLVGQAGDRDDESIRALARLVWETRPGERPPDRVVLKELPKNLRGRPPGEVTGLLADELRRLGAPENAIDFAPSELEGVKQALAWSKPGDVLLLLSHEDRQEVLELMRSASAP